VVSWRSSGEVRFTAIAEPRGYLRQFTTQPVQRLDGGSEAPSHIAGPFKALIVREYYKLAASGWYRKPLTTFGTYDMTLQRECTALATKKMRAAPNDRACVTALSARADRSPLQRARPRDPVVL
jgi:hypothetical protein